MVLNSYLPLSFLQKTTFLSKKSIKKSPQKGHRITSLFLGGILLEYLYDLVAENTLFCIWFAVANGIFCLSAIVSVCTQSFRVYAGAICVAVGGAVCVYALEKITPQRALLFFGVTAGVGGIAYLFAYVISVFLQWQKGKKLQREERYRQLQYTLPDRGNSYIRARLNTALQTEKGVEKWNTEFCYARELLNKVRQVQLCATDQLQAEQVGKTLSLFAHKEGLKTGELQVVNEAFAVLLKLAAKYGVSP